MVRSTPVLRMLALTELDRSLPVYPTLDEALLDTLVERVKEILPAPSGWTKEYGR